MGSLAFYSAMAGVGKGWREATIAKEDSKQKKLQRDHDTAIQKLRMDFENTLADKKMTHQKDLHGEEMDVRREGIGVQRENIKETRRHREFMEGIAGREADIKEDVSEAQVESYKASAEQARATAEAIRENRYRAGASKDHKFEIRETTEKSAMGDQKEYQLMIDNRHGLVLKQEQLTAPNGQKFSALKMFEQDVRWPGKYEEALKDLNDAPSAEKLVEFLSAYGFIPQQLAQYLHRPGTSAPEESE